MVKKDPRVDAYIAKAAAFAKPLLTELRARVHANCPGVVETIKWGMPAFEYLGPFAGMAAFKKHAVFGFWKHDLIVEDDGKAKEAMGSFGCLSELEQLPTKAQFAKYVKTAMTLNENGVKVERKKTRPKTPMAMHPEFKAGLAKNKKAKAGFEALAPGQQREYVEWIGEAKQDATRTRRLEQALEWLNEGKSRHWKYKKC
ncbi:MAG: YdeI/OmpD-associated family protein [Planctomycetes bacterium]|nr:YdeI/OmpD-associated family protein [Planctomycetota bacterium]MCC7171835.1 YdeI/OmpD-associated family protein [Planctomycetota bacterium]